MADHRTPGIGWMSLPAAVRRDLRDMFSRPKLRTLSIIAMKDIPIRNLQLCSNLKMLEIWDITFYTDVEPDISPVSDPPIDPTNVGSLETIWLRGDTVIQPLLVALEDASSLLSITRLRNFTVEIWDDTNFIALQAVLELVGCNLEVLKLSRLHLITGDPALPNLHNLRHIHFRLEDLASIPHVSRILESVPRPNNLEEVSIYTTLDTCTMEASAVDEGAWAWRAIDELLTRERHARRLRRVAVVVIMMDIDEETTIEAFSRQSMPQLLNLGRLRVEVDRLDHDRQVVIPLGAS
ncbi:hypothetical protein FPV67DRAFT_1667758 [Lyophyllum atratum]|nr:hypothetical protein FPV67DRAFT_1667758 [Lyophyllum atratum]